MSYVDKFGLYGDKPAEQDGMPAGNDGWILTAYAKKFGLPVDRPRLLTTYMDLKFKGLIPAERIPGDPTPPPSRDVILGLVSLDLLDPVELVLRDWNFCPYELPKFNLVQFIKQLWGLRNKHRTTMWAEPGYEQTWYVGFMVPFADRAYLLAHFGYKVPLH